MTFETTTIWQYKLSICRENKIKPIIPIYKIRFTIEQQNLSITKYDEIEINALLSGMKPLAKVPRNEREPRFTSPP